MGGIAGDGRTATPLAGPVSRPANAPASASTAPTASAPTRWRSCWCSARSPARRAAPTPASAAVACPTLRDAGGGRRGCVLLGHAAVATKASGSRRCATRWATPWRPASASSATRPACRQACDKLARAARPLSRGDPARRPQPAFNTEWLSAIELGFTLEVAEAMAHAALQPQGIARRAYAAGRRTRARRRELPQALPGRLTRPTGRPRSTKQPVNITTSPPQHPKLRRRRQAGGA